MGESNNMGKISRIRKYLHPCATEQIIHSFVTSRLDMGNSLLFGLSQDQIKCLQNAAGRLVTLKQENRVLEE